MRGETESATQQPSAPAPKCPWRSPCTPPACRRRTAGAHQQYAGPQQRQWSSLTTAPRLCGYAAAVGIARDAARDAPRSHRVGAVHYDGHVHAAGRRARGPRRVALRTARGCNAAGEARCRCHGCLRGKRRTGVPCALDEDRGSETFTRGFSQLAVRHGKQLRLLCACTSRRQHARNIGRRSPRAAADRTNPLRRRSSSQRRSQRASSPRVWGRRAH